MNKNKNIALLIASTFILFACEKTNTIPDRTSTVSNSSAFIKGLHLSPNAPVFNFFAGNKKVLSVTSATGDVETGLAFGAVVPSLSSGYSTIEPGTHTLASIVPSSSSTLGGQTIATKQANLENGKYYTIAVMDSLSRLDAIVIEDDLNIPDPTKAYFRIINAMVGGTADLEFSATTGGSSFSKNGLGFKSISNFEEMTEGTYKVYLRANGNTAKLDSISAFAPLKGKKYTLYTRGVVGQTGSTNTKRPLVFQIQNL